MNPDRNQLDELLGSLSAKPAPSLPPGFQQSVWREINRRRENAEKTGLQDLLNWLLGLALQPRPVAAALTLALLLGVFGGFAVGTAKPENRLQFEAFSMHAPGLPSSSIK